MRKHEGEVGMTDNTLHIDVDSEEFEDAPRALRDHVKKLQKALTEKDQTITEFRSQQTATALSDVLAGFTKPERVKSALLGDKVDPLDTGAVAKWIEENGNDFARGEALATPVEDQQADTGQAERERLNAVRGIGQPGTANLEAVIASVPQDLSPAHTRKWLIEHGA